MDLKAEERTFQRRNVEKVLGEASIEHRRGSEDVGNNSSNLYELENDAMQAGNVRNSQNAVLAPRIRANKHKLGRIAKMFSEIGDTKTKMIRRGIYLPSIAADTNIINNRKRQPEEETNAYGEYSSPDTENRLDPNSKAGNLHMRQQRAIQASKLPLIGRPKNLYASENSRKMKEKEGELAAVNSNPIESNALNKQINTNNFPVAFKSTLAMLHNKPMTKVPKNNGKTCEVKLVIVPAASRKITKKDGVNDSRLSYGNQDQSLIELSPSKEEIVVLSKSQNFENVIAVDYQNNETFDDTCMNPCIGIRASLIKNNEDESEELTEPGRNLSLKKSKSNLFINQVEPGKEKTIRNQKLASPLQNRKSPQAKTTPLNEGKANDAAEEKNFKYGGSKNTKEPQEQDTKTGDQVEKGLELAITAAITHERSSERHNIGRAAGRQRFAVLNQATNNQSQSNIQSHTNRQSSSVKEPHEKDPEKVPNSQKIVVSKSTALATKSAYKTISNIAKVSEKQGGRASVQNEKGLSENQRYFAYLDFLYRVSFTFAVANRPPPNQLTYKFYLGKGNNGLMVRTLLKTRWWWMPTDSPDGAEVNLIWTQLRNNKVIDSLKPKRKALELNASISTNGGNALDNSVITTTNDTYSQESMTDLTDSDSEISTLKASTDKIKSKLVRPKKTLAKDKNNDSMDTLNKIYTKTEYNDLQTFMRSNKKRMLYAEDTEDLVKSSKKGHNISVLDPIKVKICNRMECNYHLSNKKALFYNMRAYYEALKENPFDYLPLTFHIKNGTEDKEYAKFLEYYYSRENEVQEFEKQYNEADSNEKKALQSKRIKNIWIIKPGENTNRGQGIRVASERSEIEQIVNSGDKHVNGSQKTYIVQQYMDRPLLYNKRKFDIRCYMLMTSINGYMKGYWYQDGYIRTCSKEFTLKNLANKMVHLTNDAVQKKGEEYGKFENGNKVSFTDFQKYLDLSMPDSKINFQADIYPRMKNMARDSIRAVYGKIDPHRREHTFEVFGLDFMIDQNFKPWIIEVNTNPCLELSAPLLARIIPTMVENALRIAVDPLFPPPMPPSSKKNLLPDNLFENNKFELIFDEVEDGPWLRSLSSSNNEVAMGQISEEEEEEDFENDEANENEE